MLQARQVLSWLSVPSAVLEGAGATAHALDNLLLALTHCLLQEEKLDIKKLTKPLRLEHASLSPVQKCWPPRGMSGGGWLLQLTRPNKTRRSDWWYTKMQEIQECLSRANGCPFKDGVPTSSRASGGW